jgi:HPt (histidine-containing phosphotransfer) domain-containing protein
MAVAVSESHISGLREMVGDEGVSEIARAFLEDLPHLQAAVTAAIESHDLLALRRALHAFDGASSAIGLNTQALFAGDLLQRCSLGDWPDPESATVSLARDLSGPVQRIADLASSSRSVVEVE